MSPIDSSIILDPALKKVSDKQDTRRYSLMDIVDEENERETKALQNVWILESTSF